MDFGVQGGELLALELHRTGRGFDEAEDAASHRRLARPRLPHQAQGLPVLEREGDLGHGLHGRLDRPHALQRLDVEVLDQVGHLEHRPAGRPHHRRHSTPPATSSSTRTHAVSRSPTWRSSGMSPAQTSSAYAQRGRKAQPDGRPQHVRRRAHDRRQPIPAQRRQRAQQAAGVRVDRVVEQLVDGTALDDPPRVHHLDAVSDPGDDAQVVGDEDDRRAQLSLHPLDHLQDLRLHGDVERRGRLVGDEHLGVVGDGHGDHRPLAHAARELVRVLPGPGGRLRDADQVQQLDGPGAGLLVVDVLVGLDHLGDLVPHPVHRVQGGQRILEDDGQLLAPHAALHLLVDADQLLPSHLGRAGDPGRLGQQPHDGEEAHGLARSPTRPPPRPARPR